MPDALQMNRAVNTMDLDQKDEELVQFSVAYIRSMEQHEHIKWGGLDPILDMFGSNYIEALDRYIPDMLPKKNWTASDSVLTIFNSGSPKDNRSWADEQWMDNKYVWERYITESVWAIKDGGHIEEIMAKLQQAMAEDPEVRGPANFWDSFLSELSASSALVLLIPGGLILLVALGMRNGINCRTFTLASLPRTTCIHGFVAQHPWEIWNFAEE